MAFESPHTPPPSIPLSMAGFLTGSTIHVEGEAGNIHFSGQFDLHQQNSIHHYRSYTPNTNLEENQSQEVLSITRLLSSNTQNQTTHEEIHQTQIPEPPFSSPQDIGIPDLEMPDAHQISVPPATGTVTRLRSGVLSRVSYFSRRKEVEISMCDPVLHRKSFSSRKSSKLGRRKEDAMQRVLRRHSLPVRPCNSYNFFVMAKWGMAKQSSSFEETSKRLRDMWWKLTKKEKNEFVELALKDNARYRRQCMLLKRRLDVLP